ncbi:hypothetical protein B0T16DRAFT_331081, partial [Cercophora newfieldiana]
SSPPSCLSPPSLPDPTPLFTGKGHILVLNFTTGYNDISPTTDHLGCLNADGAFTLSDCAVFTVADDFPRELTTAEGGVCTFYDDRAPEHLDSYYRKGLHALSCTKEGSTVEGAWRNSFYTIRGFNYPFICIGDFGCLYETKKVPDTEKEVLSVWEYAWGAHQMNGTPGYLQVVWLWDPVKEIAEKSS